MWRHWLRGRKQETSAAGKVPAPQEGSWWARESARLDALRRSLLPPSTTESATIAEEADVLTLEGLFPELVYHLASFLPFRDLVALSRVSKCMRWLLLVRDPRLCWGKWATKLCQGVVSCGPRDPADTDEAHELENERDDEEEEGKGAQKKMVMKEWLSYPQDFPLELFLSDPLMLLRSRLFLNAREYNITWLDGHYWREQDAPSDSIRGRIYHLNSVCWLEIQAIIRSVPRGAYQAEWRMRFIDELSTRFSATWTIRCDQVRNGQATKRTLTSFEHGIGWEDFKTWVQQGWVLIRSSPFTIDADNTTVEGHILGGNSGWFGNLDLDYLRLVPCTGGRERSDTGRRKRLSVTAEAF